MDWNEVDWQTMERLRAAFLSGTAGASDYWQSESDLASYDLTFAQRIGWKWDYVLAELARRGWTPPKSELLDWGCGSGIAGRAFLDFFGANSVSALRLWDRSSLALSFAARRAREKYPGLEVSLGLSRLAGTHHPHPSPLPQGEGTAVGDSLFAERALGNGRLTKLQDRASDSPSPEGKGRGEGGASGTTLLISHVLTELTPEQTQALADFAAQAASVIWVEPGTYEASMTLLAIRERLRESLHVVAPCTHQARCGILAPENERHWCHHFAAPPSEVFQDGNWARFARIVGVDLRDLPLSFLVLDQRPLQPLPTGAARVIGHPRVYKPHALLLGCDESGVSERRLTKRAFPEEFKQLKKGNCDPLQVWHCTGDEIVETRPL